VHARPVQEPHSFHTHWLCTRPTTDSAEMLVPARQHPPTCRALRHSPQWIEAMPRWQGHQLNTRTSCLPWRGLAPRQSAHEAAAPPFSIGFDFVDVHCAIRASSNKTKRASEAHRKKSNGSVKVGDRKQASQPASCRSCCSAFLERVERNL